MNEQNVNDDRSEQRQREWDVPIDQEQDRRNDLKQKYRDQIVGNKSAPTNWPAVPDGGEAGMK